MRGSSMPAPPAVLKFARPAAFRCAPYLAGVGLVLAFRPAFAQEVSHLECHDASVYQVAFMPDGSHLVTASFDHTLRLWNLSTRKAVRTFQGHTDLVLSLAVSPDGKLLASGSQDKTVKLWDVSSEMPIANLTGHEAQVYGVAFSPDGKRLASAANDKTVRLWDVEQKKAIRTLSTQDSGVYSVQFTPDGKSVLTGGADKTVRLLDVETGAEIRRFTGPEQAVYCVDVAPDGKTFAAAGLGFGDERPVFLWEADKEQPTRVLKSHRDDLYRVEFNPQGKRVLSLGYSGTLNIWDVSGDAPLFTRDLPVVTFWAAYSPDGKQVAVCAEDGNVYLVTLPEKAR